jgi:ribosome-binding factor A
MAKPDRRRRERLPLDGLSSPGHRHARLERALLDELSLLLRDEVSDPALSDTTIHAVNLSADLHLARVHFHLPPEAPPGQARAAQLALERASGFLRAGLADALDLKRMPSLKFVHAPGAQQDDEDAWWK